jgi:hypothetical protein
MKHQLYMLSLIILIFSCKENRSEKNKPSEINALSSAIENEDEGLANNPYQDNDSQKALYKALKKKTPLTNDELFAILPEDINGNKPPSNLALQVSRQLASGIYGTFGKTSYNFFIQDGVGSLAIVRNFFDSYKIQPQGPPQTEYVYVERDGYKTISFLQPEIKRNYIRFIYNDRFQITLEGPDSADVLWSYIDFENLKKIAQFN